MAIGVSQSKLILIMEEAPFDSTVVNIFGYKPCTQASGFKTPGTLRVGGSFDGEAFGGLVSCVGFVEDKTIDCSTDCFDSSTWTSR